MSKKKSFLIYSLIILITSICATAEAKSVFIISSHDYRLAEAFHIDGNGVSFQAMVDISTYNPGIGPVGIAVWPQRGLAFFTYESSPMIVWSSTTTLKKVGELDTGIYNLAGIVVDTSKQKIYVVQRLTNYLYVYSWDVAKRTIVLDSVHDLEGGLVSAFGLALDEGNANTTSTTTTTAAATTSTTSATTSTTSTTTTTTGGGRLYVSDNSKTVRYYDTNSWAYQGSIDVVVSDVNRPAVGIAVDPVRGYLYTGNFSGGGGSHTKLVRTMTSTPYTSVETEVNYPVIGIDIDETTGFVFCTTHAYYGQYTSDFRVYNSNLTLLDIERNSNIESPAGVAVGGCFGSGQEDAEWIYPIDLNNPQPVLIGNWERSFDGWRIERGTALAGFSDTIGTTLDGPPGALDPNGCAMSLKVVGDAVSGNWCLQWKAEGPTNEDLNTWQGVNLIPHLFPIAGDTYGLSPWKKVELDATVLSSEWVEDDDPNTNPLIRLELVLNAGGFDANWVEANVWYDAGNINIPLSAAPGTPKHCVWNISAGIQQTRNVWNNGYSVHGMYYEIQLFPVIEGYESNTSGTYYLDAAYLNTTTAGITTTSTTAGTTSTAGTTTTTVP